MFPRIHESVLHTALDVVPLLEHPVTQGMEEPGVSPVQFAQGVLIPLGHTRDEDFIGGIRS
jgi:hypothetical protein